MNLKEACDTSQLTAICAKLHDFLKVSTGYPFNSNLFTRNRWTIPIPIPIYCNKIISQISHSQISCTEDSIHLLSFFAHLRTRPTKEFHPMLYLKTPNGKAEHIAIGMMNQNAYPFTSKSYIDEILNNHPFNSNIRFVIGSSFDPSHPTDILWKDFCTKYRYIPLMWIEKIENNIQGWVYIDFNEASTTESIINKLKHLQIHKFNKPKTTIINSTLQNLIKRTDLPNELEWKEKVDLAVKAFSQHKRGSNPIISKIVLARRTHLHFLNTPSPEEIISQIIRNNYGTAFIFSPLNCSSSLCGISPECLVEIDKNTIKCEAVGGSIPSSNIQTEQIKFAQMLLTDEKLLREHDIIVRYLTKVITKITKNCCTISTRQVLTLPTIQHLKTIVSSAKLPPFPPHRYPFLLHPTPAVCGTPTRAARALINSIEPFSRGWYSGFLGWASKDRCYAFPILRSMLIGKQNVYLFAGAGVVSGSDAMIELNEIEKKMTVSLRALTGQLN